jgi:CRISPR-associated protein Csx3
MSNVQLQLIELETREPCQTLAINLRQPKDLIQTQELPQLLLPPLARQLKAENKVKISQNLNSDFLIEEYFEYQAIATKNIRQVVDLAIVDVGGIPALVKRPVVEKCSHYILISHDLEKVKVWHELCEGLKPLAVIHSVWEDKLEVIDTEPFLEVVAGKWEPGCVVPEVLLDAVFEVLQERSSAFIQSSFCRIN